MTVRKTRSLRGVSLIEVSVAVAVLAVAAIGALGYQYHATRRTILAKDKLTATRTCCLLLEDWKSTGGEDNYDPSTLDMGFTATGTADQYRTRVNGLPMVVTLGWRDLESDSDAGVTLREIRTTVRWRQDRALGTIRTSDPSFVMTTYVRRDQSAG